MGFSLTGSHVVYFIAAVIAASAVSGVLIAVTNNVVTSLSERGDRIQENMDTEFEIINDPKNIPLDGSYYNFYLKNVGGNELAITNETINVFIDGEIIPTANYSFSVNSIKVGEVSTLSITTGDISLGDHKLRIVGPQSVKDEFAFEI